ncbi:pentapeptide repeat-containing protein [Streptomyces sp. NBC_00102]|uniref:pentapeptide repeat-containing protein n=1 Tax=Streptomyces sp. NBC_00102 TaxID=2975652 RepID=UPI00225A1247|nr:pentapeptide repeat-containing protein [Streptomyces sp. NBC_00102]MCX5401909.1 pentapeptide repeat-containing protein [Streptomyces sp. NBC_00102]
MGETARTTSPAPGSGTAADALRADCANCFGLCCVALTLFASADFAVDKEAGEPCSHLQEDFRCGIHRRLRTAGYPGCTVYDCFGAGQKVSQGVYAGQNWRSRPETADEMFRVFRVMRQLHEMLALLTEALGLPAAGPMREELRRAYDATERLTLEPADQLAGLDVPAHRETVAPLLRGASALVRATVPDRPGRRRPGRDLFGARLRGADLRGADLRSACLVAADLTGADLGLADVIGADFRDARLAGADLTDTLFLTQVQLNAARGDGATRIPPSLSRPARWDA